MNAEVSLRDKKATVDGELGRLLGDDGSPLLQALRYVVLSGGKRFRPLLLLAAGEAFGGDGRDLLPYACAVELIHSYSLVHDDLPCMDDDDYRRGRPSCHKAFGEGQAILIGDGLLTLAFEVLAEAPAGAAGPSRKERSVVEIIRAAGIRGMIRGQWLDIGFSPAKATQTSYEELILEKTGALILASLRAGAILGGADEAGILAMNEYGRNISLAFQMRDDLQDSAAEKEKRKRISPNAVALFGLEGAKKKTALCLDRAVRALDGAVASREELLYLAGGFLDRERAS